MDNIALANNLKVLPKQKNKCVSTTANISRGDFPWKLLLSASYLKWKREKKSYHILLKEKKKTQQFSESAEK